MRTELLTAVAVLATASMVWAGRVIRVEVHLDTTARTAYGSLRGVADSPDLVQYLGCSLGLRDGEVSVYCFANDSASHFMSCESTNPELVKIAQSISDNSYISFACGGADGALSKLQVTNSSLYLSK